MKSLIFLLALTMPVSAQINPPKYSAYVNSGTGWEPWSSAAAGGAIAQPPAIALYCQASAGASWTPCTGSGGGGGTPSGPAGGDLGGTYPNPTVAASHITSGAAAFTGSSSVTSSADSSSTATFAINDTAAGSSVMIGSSVFAPNMISGNNLYFLLGQSISSGTSYWMRYSKATTGNYLAFQPASQPIQFVMFMTGNSAFGNVTTDSGFKLDVVGTGRSQTQTLTTAATTAGALGYDSTGNRFSAFTGGLVGTPNRTIFTLLSNVPTVTNTTTQTTILNGASTVQGTTTLPSGYITVGRKFKIGVSGVYSVVTNDDMVFNIVIGGTTVASSGTIHIGSSVTNGEYNLDTQITCRSIAANVATCIIRGWVQVDTATAGQRETISIFNGGNTFTLPTNIANLVDVTMAFSAANTGDTATTFSAGLYEIN